MMSERDSSVVGLESRLKAILKAPEDVALEDAQALVADQDPNLDSRLFTFVAGDYVWPRVKCVACRLLAERDRDRDPTPLTALFDPGMPKEEATTWLKRMWRNNAAYPVIVSFEYGFSRLRKLAPVRSYMKILTEEDYGPNVRANATLGLGDTGELEALEPLTIALGDSHPAVRGYAADSVRRLRHAGAAGVVASHPVRDRLITGLHDPKKNVRLAAARALGSLGDLAPLRERQQRSPRDRAELDRILQGDIPPLAKTWPGDRCT